MGSVHIALRIVPGMGREVFSLIIVFLVVCISFLSTI